MRYLALLRGINVGGKNIIPMSDLRQLFEENGFKDVTTYIQSGNVVFSSRSRSVTKLSETIESALANRYQYDAKVFVIGSPEYSSQLSFAHKDFGISDSYKHNAMFVLGNSNPSAILEQLKDPIEKIEMVSIASRTIFWSAKKEALSRTSMMTLPKNKHYKQLTVRNHKTTFKLANLLAQ